MRYRLTQDLEQCLYGLPAISCLRSAVWGCGSKNPLYPRFLTALATFPDGKHQEDRSLLA